VAEPLFEHEWIVAMDYALARRTMVENQLRTNQIEDARVVAAMGRIPRELFVPTTLKGISYVDEDLPLGNGRYLMEPLVLARLLQVAAIGPEDVVLEVGCGNGYNAAVMSQLASTVIALESDPGLVAESTRLFGELELDNIVVVEGSLRDGYAEGGPYDVITFGGAVTDVPAALFDQLAAAGRVVAVVSPRRNIGKIKVFSRSDGGTVEREAFDAFTPVLPGFEIVPKFTF
jgi:protein-L-isoaspartate(D-aspartate) O-methyltransferase